jgi:hypothetical protein
MTEIQWGPSVKYEYHCANFHETHDCHAFLRDLYIEFHENLTGGLVGDNRTWAGGRTDGHGLYIKLFLLLRKRHLSHKFDIYIYIYEHLCIQLLVMSFDKLFQPLFAGRPIPRHVSLSLSLSQIRHCVQARYRYATRDPWVPGCCQVSFWGVPAVWSVKRLTTSRHSITATHCSPVMRRVSALTQLTADFTRVQVVSWYHSQKLEYLLETKLMFQRMWGTNRRTLKKGKK